VTDPLVSAIVIFHDEEPFLDEAVRSVLAQSYPNWELLLCDDGSRDGSTAIAQRYAEAYSPKVRYLSHEGHANRGMSATRNLGLRSARGEYVAWLDADDVWLPHKLERQVRLMDEHPEAAMVYGPLHLWFSWSGRHQDFRRDFTQELGVPPDAIVPPPQLLLAFLENDMHLPAGELVRREVLEAVGGYDESTTDEFEDEIVYFRICRQFPVFAAGESWYRYRQHDRSFSASLSGHSRRAVRARRRSYLERLADELRTWGGDSGEIAAALQKELGRQRGLRSALADVAALLALPRGALRAGLRTAREVGDRAAPRALRGWVGRQVYGGRRTPPPGWLDLGNLRRVTPISPARGSDRGTPVNSYYAARFFAAHDADARGRVLELDHGRQVPDGLFDCVLVNTNGSPLREHERLTAAVNALRPGGVLLAVLPNPGLPDVDGRGPVSAVVTPAAATRLLEEQLGPGVVEIESYGNVLTTVAALHGLAADELEPEELEHRDPAYATMIGLRAVKRLDGAEG
jgi:glycosyltransferase involved in cell wall biosynthesis